PDTALRIVALLGLLAAALGISLRESGAFRWGRAAACSFAAIAACITLPPSWTELHLSEYKGLSQAVLVPGTEVIAEESSPLGLLTVVSSPTVPLRYVPGLSLSNATEPPAQLGVFTDGDGLTAIAAFAGHLYARPGVGVHVAEARSFVAGQRDRYDVIQIPLLGSLAAAAAGTHSLSESYVYTIEAFEQYLDCLRPGGYLAITRWLKLPPRDSLRLFATAVSALERRGIRESGRHLALIRSWNTTTLLVKNSPLTGQDV